jgi:hypothetical protein
MVMKLRRPPTYVLALTISAALLLGACGGDTTVESGLRAPTPVKIVSGGGGATAAAGNEAKLAADASAELSIAPVSVELVLGEVGSLPANSTGYVFPSGVTIPEDRVTKLAKALGVSGTPAKGEAGSGVSWQVGPTDGSGNSLSVGSDAQGGWWYSGQVGDRGVLACAAVSGPDGTVTEDCPEPEPPAGVPSAAEAKANAVKLLEALGEDPDALTVTANADDWSANVEAVAPLDGVDSPLRWSFGFGENGVLTYASGVLARPEKVGPYPLVGLEEAFARLQRQNAPWASGGWSAMSPAKGGDTAVAFSKVAGGPAEDPAAEEVAVDDVAVDSGAPAERVTVTLNKVEADLWWAWDEAGAVWLLPAYRFIGDDGGWYVVPAVTDEFLIEVPQPAVDAPASPPVAPVEPDTPVEPDGTVDLAALEPAVGQSLEAFTKAATELGASVRVVQQDGKALAVTEDFQPRRVNVAVDKGRVTGLVSVG